MRQRSGGAKIKPLAQPLPNISSEESGASWTSPCNLGPGPDMKRYRRTRLPPLPKKMEESLTQCLASSLVETVRNLSTLNEAQRKETFTSDYFLVTKVRNPSTLQSHKFIEDKRNLLLQRCPPTVDLSQQQHQIANFLENELDFINFFSQTSHFKKLLKKYNLGDQAPQTKSVEEKHRFDCDDVDAILQIDNASADDAASNSQNFKAALRNFFIFNVNEESFQIFYLYLFEKVELTQELVSIDDKFFAVFGGECCFGYALCALEALLMGQMLQE